MAEVERLARVAYVAYMEEAGDADRTNWEAEPSLYRALWQRVVEAVLAEQAEPTGPKGMAEQEVRRTRIYGAAYGVLAGKMSWSTMERAIAQSVTDSVLAALAEWEVTRR